MLSTKSRLVLLKTNLELININSNLFLLFTFLENLNFPRTRLFCINIYRHVYMKITCTRVSKFEIIPDIKGNSKFKEKIFPLFLHYILRKRKSNGMFSYWGNAKILWQLQTDMVGIEQNLHSCIQQSALYCNIHN